MQFRAALALALLASVGACQRGEHAGDWKASPLGRDMDRICNAVVQSGAIEQPEGARQLLVAQWLGANLEGQEARDFLAQLSSVPQAGKPKALEDQAAKVGITRCPLADEWRTP